MAMLSTSLPRAAIFAVVAFAAPVLSGGGCLPYKPVPDVIVSARAGTLVASTPGAVASSSVTELSGLSASRLTADVYWVHNDSGDSARIFAVRNDGADLGAYSLSGATAIDWEDIAVGPGPTAGVNYIY